MFRSIKQNSYVKRKQKCSWFYERLPEQLEPVRVRKVGMHELIQLTIADVNKQRGLHRRYLGLYTYTSLLTS